MKLLFCSNCVDIVLLTRQRRYCSCEESYGEYQSDGDFVNIGGQAKLIGILSSKFYDSYLKRNQENKEKKQFTAFFFEDNYHKINRITKDKKRK